jgi:hypothetical protein
MAGGAKTAVSFGGIAIAVENVCFPLLFFYYALRFALSLYNNYPGAVEVFARLREFRFSSGDIVFISNSITSCVLVILNLLVCRGFLFRSRLHHVPRGFLNIFIPLVSTFSYLMYSILQNLPQKWNYVFLPEGLLLPLCIFGVFFALLGTVISTIATLDLKRSFGIFVQVRKIESQGLYRQVRHPLYLGYIINALALCLLEPNLNKLLLTSIAVPLMIFRARLEEKELAAYSSEYREYAGKTPFLFPR